MEEMSEDTSLVFDYIGALVGSECLPSVNITDLASILATDELVHQNSPQMWEEARAALRGNIAEFMPDPDSRSKGAGRIARRFVGLREKREG